MPQDPRRTRRPLLAALAAGAALALLSGIGCSKRASQVTLLAAPEVPGLISRDPSIALDPRNNDVVLTWLAGDSLSLRVWFSRSTDAGHSWSTPMALSPPGEPLEPQGEATPRIACDAHGRIAIMWATGAEVANGDRPPSELRLVRSLDRGATWSAPTTLHEGLRGVPRTQRFHDLAATDEGKLIAAWLANPASGDTSHRAGGEGASIYIARSSDFGGHWGQAQSAWSRVCPCCRVGVGVNLVGDVFAAFRRHYEDGGCDVALARPSGPPVSAYHDHWTVESCPRSGPGFEVGRDGTLRVAWYTGVPGRTGVWFRQAAPEQYDTTVTPMLLMATASQAPLHVSVGDGGMAGTLIACDGDSLKLGPMTLIRVDPSGGHVVERITVAGANDAVRPQVAASNRSQSAFVAWSERRDGRRHLQLLRWDVGR